MQSARLKSLILFALIISVSACNNQSENPADVENGVADTTNIFAPDTTQAMDTASSNSNIRDTGLRP